MCPGWRPRAREIGVRVALTRFARSLLYGEESNDPATLAAAALLMAVFAAPAGYLPARRAMAVDPVTALRCE